jgi:hypothetical protein
MTERENIRHRRGASQQETLDRTRISLVEEGQQRG